MGQVLLVPLYCTKCGKPYYELGYWRDNIYCRKCSDILYKDRFNRAQKIKDKYNLDLLSIDDEHDPNVRQGRRYRMYKDSYCEDVIELGAEGKGHLQIACALKISEPTLFLWEKKYPRFKMAMQIAKQELSNTYMNTVWLAANGRIKVNGEMLTWFGKNMLKWGDLTNTNLRLDNDDMPQVRLENQDKNFPTETLEPSDDVREQAESAETDDDIDVKFIGNDDNVTHGDSLFDFTADDLKEPAMESANV
jgi:hypothetical protein